MQQYFRFRFHLSSGVRVDRYIKANPDAVPDKDNIKEFASVFQNAMTDSRVLDNTGGVFIPNMSAVLMVEIDIVNEMQVDARS